jgi:TolB-like protein/Tfp pilus assembly protein PilF
MKSCPKCKRDYFDDSLIYCLEDGAKLFGQFDRSEPQTAILTPAATSFEQVNSIAVLPFVNISADPENEYFCDGLSEELLNALSHIAGLKVAARTSTFSFKGKNADVEEIGRRLGVKTVLEGSVRKAGERIRVSVQLTNAVDGFHLWSERYDREMKDIFDIQDEITLAIVDSLKLKLLSDRRGNVLKRYTDNTQAYSLYLQGRYFWNKRTTDGAKRAIEYFEHAIRVDPNYALAYSGIADCYNTSGFAYDLGSVPAEEVIAKANAAALKALEIDDSLAEAYSSLAYAKHLFEWEFQGAEALFRRALELNPNYANARHWYAHLLMAGSRFEEALVESKRALELDPLSAVMNNHLGWHYMYTRQYERAIEQLEHTFRMSPEFLLSKWYLGLVYEQLGKHEQAEAAFLDALKLAKDDLIIRADVAHFYAVSGQGDKALKELEELETIAKSRPVSTFSLAMICVGIEHDDRAFELLDRAYREHSDMLVYLNVDPRFDRIRNDDRFKLLIQKVGLPQQNI